MCQSGEERWARLLLGQYLLVNKVNNVEPSEVIMSMFHWYQGVFQCYLYLSDILAGENDQQV